MTEDSLVERARAFATRFHESVNHVRKYTEDPYTEHLKAVAEMVEEVSGTSEMIAAAWLHDVVEDTPATFVDVEAEFGPKVAKLVQELTDVSKPEDGNRAIRKALDRAHLAKASADTKTIKLADLIDNARSILEHDPRFAQTFMREMGLLLEILEGGDPRLLSEATNVHYCYFSDVCSS